jgi:hypothetical protein
VNGEKAGLRRDGFICCQRLHVSRPKLEGLSHFPRVTMPLINSSDYARNGLFCVVVGTTLQAAALLYPSVDEAFQLQTSGLRMVPISDRTDQAFFDSFNALFPTPLFDERMPRPLLAHYTSIKVMEAILHDSKVWFSNPLFMNDMQEVRFGINEGVRLFYTPDLLKKAVGTEERSKIIQSAFAQYYSEFNHQDAFDTYVFCLSEHDLNNNDGILSMWRGYGQHGEGVALVFDTAALTLVPTSPLIISRVTCASDHDRSLQLAKMLERWADLAARTNLPDNKLFIGAGAAFAAIKDYALTTKHTGFSEEAEWRVIYYPERDRAGLLKECMDYHIGERGVEPKLKYKIGHIPGVSAADLTLDRLLDRIILGPSHSSPLARRSVERMLEKIGKPDLKRKLYSSAIPLRPSSGGVF